MNKIVEETLRVSAEYKFSEFSFMNNNNDFESCSKNLDIDFMACLKNGDHLNVNILPL